jgi:hypothetical protein
MQPEYLSHRHQRLWAGCPELIQIINLLLELGAKTLQLAQLKPIFCTHSRNSAASVCAIDACRCSLPH